MLLITNLQHNVKMYYKFTTCCKFALAWGLLPLVVLNPTDAKDILVSYVHTYIKEEIKEEGLIRKAEPFVRFLEIAAMMNGQQINAENIARDAKIPRSTVDIYFSILEDTLLGYRLPSYRPRAKVREQTHPKYYWFDSCVARAAAGLLNDAPDPAWLGYALETLVYLELRVHNHISGKERLLFFYRVSNTIEIDFIIETRKAVSASKAHVVCVEEKHAKTWNRRWETPMRDLASSGKVVVEKMFGVYQGDHPYHFDGVDVYPIGDFLKILYEGKVF